MTLAALIPIAVLLCFGAWRAALIVLGAALLIDFLIALLRVGVRATLEQGTFSVKLLAGPLRLTVLPKNGDRAKKPPKSKKAGKDTTGGGEEKKNLPVKITLELVSTVLNAVGELLGRLRRKISVDKLVIHYTAASKDPCSAALVYGYASAGVAALMPVIENIFKVKERDVGAAVTFDRPESEIFIDAQLTLAIWEILYIAFAVWPVVKAVIAQYMNSRKVDKNGQSSDQ